MKKPLKVAAWAGIINFVLSILFAALIIFLGDKISTGVTLVFSLIAGILGIFFIYGFVVLAKKFNSQLLLVMSWIGIAIEIISIIFALIFNILTMVQNVSAQEILDNSAIPNETAIITFVYLAIWIVFSLLFGAYSVLFGVGLLKLGDKVELSKVSGILEIVAGATMIILIGFFVKMVAIVFEIVLLWKVAEKSEK